MMIIWSVVGRDVIVRWIKVRGRLVAGIPEWYKVVVDVPVWMVALGLDVNVVDRSRDGELRCYC